MYKNFCDLCEKEIKHVDGIRFVSMVDEANKPLMPKKEVCVFCSVEIKEFIMERLWNKKS